MNTLMLFISLIPFFWLLQNIIHEGSHLIAGWLFEGRKPLKLIPWPTKLNNRWVFAAYVCGPATKEGPARYRHVAPVIVSLTLLTIWSCIGILTENIFFILLGMFPFFDACLWLFGYIFNRPGTDGFRYRTE